MFSGRDLPTAKGLRRKIVVASPLSKPRSMSEYTSFEFLTMIETKNIDV